mgnify:CR=1 FL=1
MMMMISNPVFQFPPPRSKRKRFTPHTPASSSENLKHEPMSTHMLEGGGGGGVGL